MEPETYNLSQYVIPAIRLANIGLLGYAAYLLRQNRKEAEHFGEKMGKVGQAITKEGDTLSLELRTLASNSNRLNSFLKIYRTEYVARRVES